MESAYSIGAHDLRSYASTESSSFLNSVLSVYTYTVNIYPTDCSIYKYIQYKCICALNRPARGRHAPTRNDNKTRTRSQQLRPSQSVALLFIFSFLHSIVIYFFAPFHCKSQRRRRRRRRGGERERERIHSSSDGCVFTIADVT